MSSKIVIRVARILWAFPALLLFLTVNQADVAYDLRQTLEEGTPAVAEVTGSFIKDRVDIQFGYLNLRVPMEEGEDLVQDKMALPYTLIKRIETASELDVMVRRGADQQIVITQIGGTQWKIAAMQSGICFVTFFMAATGLFFWGRLLKREGDPGHRPESHFQEQASTT